MSAFAFGGVPREVLSQVLRTADIYVSPALLKEYRAVPGELLTEEKVTLVQWQTLIAGVASFVTGAKVVFPRKTIVVCRNAEDNMVLECCLTARANVLITSDKDLLELGPDTLRRVGLGKLLVVSPRAYSILQGVRKRNPRFIKPLYSRSIQYTNDAVNKGSNTEETEVI